MSGETISMTEATKQADDGQPRQRSTISFPYVDMGAGLELASAIHGHVGLGECTEEQLAVWTNQSPKSSKFREQIRVARMAGVMEVDSGKCKLTDLGRAIVDPNKAGEAKARAFLNVPLFKAVFEKYSGGVLPPSAALERDIVGLGVSEKQKDRARQVLERSADQGGFFAHGKNRLVMPAVVVREEIPPAPEDKEKNRNGSNGGGHTPPTPPTPPRHPFIEGLLQSLPKPEEDWPAAGRVKWLQTAANIFDLIYKGDGGIKIELAMAQRSPRPSE
jgi:hypothetical protein